MSCQHCRLTHGVTSKWNHFLHVTNFSQKFLSRCLQPLECTLRFNFIPALTGRYLPGDTERDLLALPISIGGIGIFNPEKLSLEQYLTSKSICTPLVKLITSYATCDGEIFSCVYEQKEMKIQIQQGKCEDRQQVVSHLRTH